MNPDEIMEKPYWIIDILPGRVPENSPGQAPAGNDPKDRVRRRPVCLEAAALNFPDPSKGEKG